MESLNEILNARIAEGNTVPDSVRTIIRDTMAAPTNERYTNQALERLGDVPAWISGEGVEVVDEPIVPSLAVFFATAGISDDKAKKEGYKDAKDMFVNGYAKHVKAWNKKIEKNPVLGSQGVKTFKDLWTRAVYDDADEKLKEARKNLGDAEANYGLFTANIPGSEFITKMAFPRTTERLANTGDWSGKDLALDLGENALMMVPGSGWVKAGGTVARKVAPSLVLRAANEAKKLANSGSYIAPLIPKAVTMTRNVGANAIVPFMAEKADDIAYDVGEGMDDRANFDWGDAIVGTAVNQAVNQGLLRDMLPLVSRYGGVDRKANSAAKSRIREFMSTLGQSQKKLGNDLVEESRAVVNNPVIRMFDDGSQVTMNELEGLKKSVNIIPEGVTFEEFVKAKDVDRVAKMIEEGDLTFKDLKAIKEGIKENRDAKIQQLKQLIRGYKNEARIAADNGEEQAAAEALSKANDLSYIIQKKNTISGATPYDVINGIENSIDVDNARALPSDVVASLFEEKPEMYNYAFWKNAPWYYHVQNAVHQAWPSLVVNKAGKTDYASDVVRATKDITEQNRKESKEQSKKSQVSKIISARPELSSTDLKWLNAIKENPDIVKNGYNKGSVKDADDFKMWLLLGGNDLLRGSDVHRPLWDIE